MSAFLLPRLPSLLCHSLCARVDFSLGPGLRGARGSVCAPRGGRPSPGVCLPQAWLEGGGGEVLEGEHCLRDGGPWLSGMKGGEFGLPGGPRAGT